MLFVDEFQRAVDAAVLADNITSPDCKLPYNDSLRYMVRKLSHSFEYIRDQYNDGNIETAAFMFTMAYWPSNTIDESRLNVLLRETGYNGCGFMSHRHYLIILDDEDEIPRLEVYFNNIHDYLRWADGVRIAISQMVANKAEELI